MDQNSSQVYTIPTYDSIFKWVLSEDSIRPSFFHAFIPHIQVESSTRLDEHMNPVETLQLARHFLNDKEISSAVELLQKKTHWKVCMKDSDEWIPNDISTRLLSGFVERFSEIQEAFPKAEFDGTMDFVCKLNTNEYVLIEMQIRPQDHWDKRALSYLAAFYSNQIRKGSKWFELERVIAVNILGGGKDNMSHWKDSSNQCIRHYKMQEQLQKNPARFIDWIELIQYSLSNASLEDFDTQEKKDWILFFKEAHHMTEETVKKKIKTPAVLAAFEKAKITNLPKEVRKVYEEEEKKYAEYSIHIAEEVAKGKAEGKAEGQLETKIEIARSLKNRGMEISVIQEISGLSEKEIKQL